GYAYLNLGETYFYLKRYDDAVENLAPALSILEEQNELDGLSGTYSRLGKVYQALGSYSLALENFAIDLELSRKISFNYHIAEYNIDIVTVYTALNQHEKARGFLIDGLQLGLELGAKEQIKDAYHGIYILDSLEGSYKKALQNMNKYLVYRDSLYNEKNIRELTKTSIMYEFDKKLFADSLANMQRKAIITATLQRQRVYIWVGVGVALFSLLFLIYVFRSRRKISREKNR